MASKRFNVWGILIIAVYFSTVGEMASNHLGSNNWKIFRGSTTSIQFMMSYSQEDCQRRLFRGLYPAPHFKGCQRRFKELGRIWRKEYDRHPSYIPTLTPLIIMDVNSIQTIIVYGRLRTIVLTHRTSNLPWYLAIISQKKIKCLQKPTSG